MKFVFKEMVILWHIYCYFRYVIANDLSPSAVAAIKRNVELNNLDLVAEDGSSGNDGDSVGKIHVHEGDAWLVAIPLCYNSNH